MRKTSCWMLAAMLPALMACSPAPSPQTDAAIPARQDPIATAVSKVHAGHARLRAEDPDSTAREITALEYPAYRELMKASGLDAALGGEAAGDTALRALFALSTAAASGSCSACAGALLPVDAVGEQPANASSTAGSIQQLVLRMARFRGVFPVLAEKRAASGHRWISA